MKTTKSICLAVVLFIVTVAQANVDTSFKKSTAISVPGTAGGALGSVLKNIAPKPISPKPNDLTLIHIGVCSPTYCCYYVCNNDGSGCILTDCVIRAENRGLELDESKSVKLALAKEFR